MAQLAAVCNMAARSGRRSDGEALHLTAKGFWARRARYVSLGLAVSRELDRNLIAKREHSSLQPRRDEDRH